jgi:hypothetical protein
MTVADSAPASLDLLRRDCSTIGNLMTDPIPFPLGPAGPLSHMGGVPI